MSKMLRNDEDYKREVLDLYSYIATICSDGVCLPILLSASDSAIESLERIRVYRISSVSAGLNY